MASPIKDPRWIIAALIMIVATSFNFLNTSTSAVAQSSRNDRHQEAVMRGIVANNEKLVQKLQVTVRELEKLIEKAKADLSDQRESLRYWQSELTKSELQDREGHNPANAEDYADLAESHDGHVPKKWRLIEGDFPYFENVISDTGEVIEFPGLIKKGTPEFKRWEAAYSEAEKNSASRRSIGTGGGFCTYDEPSKAEPVRRIVRKIVGYDKVCRGNYCEMIPRYADVEVVELPIDEPIVSSTYDQPPACDDPSVATTSIVRNLSSSDGPPGCPCEVCECENCIYDQASMTSFLAGESPARVKGFQPVRSFLQSRPLRSFLQARPVRSFFGRLFGR
jgi:hypothetical protein